MGGGGIWAKYVNDFKARVIADGGTMESPSCAKSDVKFLVQNPEPVAFTGLLNDYSGAAAAYSLRLLDNTYTGNAIKVRRASDNAEQDIAFSNNELDTATLESFASGTDAFVTTWYDQSGNGNDADQAAASAQPKIVSSGSTILENGKPAIDGLNGAVLKIQGITNLTLNTWIFSATKSDSNARIFVADNGSAPYYGWSGSSTTAGSAGSGATAYYYANGTAIGDTQNDIATAMSTQSVFTINADLSAMDRFLTLGFNTGLEMFKTIQDCVIYDTDQSANRTGIETNINDFYSIY
jgi:hypothetical protein